MNPVTYLCLLLTLTACTALAHQGMEEQPPAAAGPETSVLLMQWNAEQQQQVRPVDPVTGRTPAGYAPINLGNENLYTPGHARSADGRKLAIIAGAGQSCEPYAGGTSCRLSADKLYLIDVPGWREVQVSLPGQGWVGPLAFSPDNARLAMVYNEPEAHTLMLFDVASGEGLVRQTLDFAPTLLAYTQDGAALVVYGTPEGAEPGMSQPAPPAVQWFDAASLALQWEQTLTHVVSGQWCLENCASSHELRSFAFWQPAVVFSPDGRKLYLVHADEERLTTVDFASQTVQSTAVEVAQSWSEWLLSLTAGVAQAKAGINGASKAAVLSVDGTRLYLAGQVMQTPAGASGHEQMETTFLGLQVIDVATGHKVASYDSEATGIRLTPDGAYLLLDGWGANERWTEIWDAQSFQRLTRLEGWEVGLSRRLDGQPVLLARQPGEPATQFAVLVPPAFEIGPIWSVDGYAEWIAEE